MTTQSQSGASVRRLSLGGLYVIVLGVMLVVFMLPRWLPGNTALYDAIDDGDSLRVRQLLDGGSDPNSRARGVFAFRSSRYRSPPLLFALERSHPALAEMLIASGADPNARDSNGRPALFVAAAGGHAQVVRALIEKGADVHAVSTADGETALRFGPKGPGGQHPAWANRPKELAADMRMMLERAGAK